MAKFLGLGVNQYVSSALQYYLAQFIQDIELEGKLHSLWKLQAHTSPAGGLGILGGTVVLNNLELRKDVLRVSPKPTPFGT